MRGIEVEERKEKCRKEKEKREKVREKERKKIEYNILFVFTSKGTIGSIYKNQLFTGCKKLWEPILGWSMFFEVLVVK